MVEISSWVVWFSKNKSTSTLESLLQKVVATHMPVLWLGLDPKLSGNYFIRKFFHLIFVWEDAGWCSNKCLPQNSYTPSHSYNGRRSNRPELPFFALFKLHRNIEELIYRDTDGLKSYQVPRIQTRPLQRTKPISSRKPGFGVPLPTTSCVLKWLNLITTPIEQLAIKSTAIGHGRRLWPSMRQRG